MDLISRVNSSLFAVEENRHVVGQVILLRQIGRVVDTLVTRDAGLCAKNEGDFGERKAVAGIEPASSAAAATTAEEICIRVMVGR